MSRRTVVVADPIHADGLARLGESHDVIALDADTAGPEVARALSIADAIIVRLFEVTAETAAAAPRLKVVAKHGVGTDNIDVAAMTARGIVVANTPGANATAVAEMAVALMLGLVKRVADLDRAVRGGRFFELHHLGHEQSLALDAAGGQRRLHALMDHPLMGRVLIHQVYPLRPFGDYVKAQHLAEHPQRWHYFSKGGSDDCAFNRGKERYGLLELKASE